MGWLLFSAAFFLLLADSSLSDGIEVFNTSTGNSGSLLAPNTKDDRKRVYDIMNIFGNLNFKRDIFITVRIYESQCYESSTKSTYIVYLASLSFDGHFLEWFPISSVHGVNRKEDGNSYTLFEITIPENDFLFDPELCLSQGSDPCVPRGDAIYINYHNEIEDRWSIRNIEVEVEFRLWPGHDNWHSYRYNHPVLVPCDQWMTERAIYQIGPRVGLFTKIEQVPLAGQWIRDWI